MVDLTKFLNKSGGDGVDRVAGRSLNAGAKPINSFISKVNNTLGTNISTINPNAALKAAMSGQISTLFSGGLNKGSHPREVGSAYSKQNVVSELSKRGDPLTNFEWMAVVVNKSGKLEHQLPWYYVDDITVPAPNFALDEKYVDGKDKKYAGKFSISTCTIKVYSDVTGLAFNFCNEWCQSIYRADGLLYQMPSAYKKDIYVFLLDITRKVVIDIQLLGCWPSSWGEYSLTSGSSAALETSLTLNVDDFKMNFDGNPVAVIENVKNTINSGTWSTKKDAVSAVTQGNVVQSALTEIRNTAAQIESRINKALQF